MLQFLCLQMCVYGWGVVAQGGVGDRHLVTIPQGGVGDRHLVTIPQGGVGDRHLVTIPQGGVGDRHLVTIPQGGVGDRLPWAGERHGGGEGSIRRCGHMGQLQHIPLESLAIAYPFGHGIPLCGASIGLGDCGIAPQFMWTAHRPFGARKDPCKKGAGP